MSTADDVKIMRGDGSHAFYRRAHHDEKNGA
ncbi:hypothetical protein BB65665_07133 [Bacillus sp. 916]|nr:hypothetical protein BB65665_07133 [Bacillus sp. 916]